MSNNPYKILGVDKSATKAEIKKAYRTKAKQHHPDKGGDEAEFKKINQAYEILGDEQKRSQFDQFGSAGPQGGFGGSNGGGFGGSSSRTQGFGDFSAQDFSGFEDVFSSFFGGGGGRARNPRAPQRGADLEVEADITFAESVTGVTKKFSARRYKACEKCDQKGGSGQKTCATCGGSGHITQTFQTPFGNVQQQATCGTCHGSGQTFENLCKTCHGETRYEDKATIEVKIPAGIKAGQTLRMRQDGDAGKYGGPAGDFYVHIRVAEDKNWEREGLDLVQTLEIPVFEALKGSEVQAKTFWSTKTLKIPPLTADRTRLKIKGQGIKRDGQAGNHIVVVKYKLPKKVSKKLNDLLEQAAKEA